MTEIGNNKALFLFQDDNNNFYYLTKTGSYILYNSSDSLDDQAFTPIVNLTEGVEEKDIKKFNNLSMQDEDYKLVADTNSNNYKLVTTIGNNDQFPIEVNLIHADSLRTVLEYDTLYLTDQKNNIKSFAGSNINYNGNIKFVTVDDTFNKILIFGVIIFIIIIVFIIIGIFIFIKRKKKKNINNDINTNDINNN